MPALPRTAVSFFQTILPLRVSIFWPGFPARPHIHRGALARFPSQSSSMDVRSGSLLQELESCVLNSDTLHGVPAAPPTDQHQKLTFSPSDRDHPPQRTTHL